MASSTRSPNYPQIDLGEAIERIGQVYDAEGTHPAGDQAIARDLGYTSLNGTSRSVLSALRKYGLLEREGDGFRVSQDAVTIIELLPQEPEFIAAVHRCAFRPALFAELYERFGRNLPSDNNLRHFLITRKFNPKTADEVIRVYRDTLRLAMGELSESTTAPERATQKASTDVSMPTDRGRVVGGETSAQNVFGLFGAPNRADTERPMTELRFKISRTGEARIQLSGDVTQKSIETLIEILKVQKVTFPEGAEPEHVTTQQSDSPLTAPGE